MAVTEIFTGSEAVGTTEHSMTTDTAGPDTETSDHAVQVCLELDDMVYTDELLIQLYETCRSGGTQIRVAKWTVTGDRRSWFSPIVPLMHGWDWTLDAIVGTITVDWSLRSLGAPAEFASGIETVSTTEWSLTTDSSGPDADTNAKGIFAFIDFAAVDDGDHYQVKLYEKARSSDAQFQVGQPKNIRDGQSDPMLIIPLLALINGWDITVKKLAGTDRSIEWSLRSFA